MYAANSTTGLPIQQLTYAEKRKTVDKFGVSEWEKKCLDGLENIAKLQFFNNYKLKQNYELVRGVFDYNDYINDKDYFDLTSALSQQLNLPAYIRHYDIITKGINVLKGEFINRPDLFRVKAFDDFSFNEITEEKSKMLVSYYKTEVGNFVNKQLIANGFNPFQDKFENQEQEVEYQQLLQEKSQELTPKGIQKYFETDYYTEAEKFGNAIINIDRERFNLKEMELQEFEDLLVADRCFRHFFLTSSGYAQERWNPIFTFHHISPQVLSVEDGDFAGQFVYLSKAQIIDKFGWMMTKEQKEMLYPKVNGDKIDKSMGLTNLANMGMRGALYPYADYKDMKLQENLLGVNPHTGLPAMPGMYPYDVYTYDFNEIIAPGISLNFNASEYVQVTQGYWRSQMLQGKLNYVDPETGDIESILVDESFDPSLYGIEEVESTFENSDEPNTICWTWKTQIWQGIKINLNYNAESELTRNALYIDVRPARLQLTDPLNEDRCKLPVIGKIFNNMNSKSTSLVDIMKPYQIVYNALWNRAYDIQQREIGVFMLMDTNILPNLKDWGGNETNMEKAMAIAKSWGLFPVSTKATVTGNSQFAANNSYQVMNMDVSEQVKLKIETAMIVEDQCYKQLGITPQRMGTVQASETATGTREAISNSYAQTESYFEKYYNFKKECMNINIQVAQLVYGKEDDITLNYILPDTNRAFMKVTDPLLSLRKLGVYVVNSQELRRQLETIRGLAINNNTTNIPMSSLVKMAVSNSPREIVKELQFAEQQFAEQQQAQQQHEQEMQQAQIEAAAAEKEKDRENENMNKQLDRQTELEKVVLQGVANEGSYSPTTDTTGLLIDQGKLALEQSKYSADISFRNRELANQTIEALRKEKQEKEKMTHDKKLKESEQKSKQKVENQKLEQIKVQNQNQLELANKKAKADEKLMEKKIELEKIKAKVLERKAEIEVKKNEQKIKSDKKIGDTKHSEVKSLSSIKKNEAKKISDIKVDETEKLSKINIDAQKKLAREKIKQAKKPKSPK